MRQSDDCPLPSKTPRQRQRLSLRSMQRRRAVGRNHLPRAPRTRRPEEAGDCLIASQLFRGTKLRAVLLEQRRANVDLLAIGNERAHRELRFHQLFGRGRDREQGRLVLLLLGPHLLKRLVQLEEREGVLSTALRGQSEISPRSVRDQSEASPRAIRVQSEAGPDAARGTRRSGGRWCSQTAPRAHAAGRRCVGPWNLGCFVSSHRSCRRIRCSRASRCP
jgi:hypothetical protein